MTHATVDEVPSIGQNLKPLSGNGDVLIWVKNSHVGVKTTNNWLEKEYKHQWNSNTLFLETAAKVEFLIP